MQHFLIPNGFEGDSVVLRDSELLHQLIKVLRFRVGSECVLMDGQGKKALAELEVLHKKEAVFKIKTVEWVPAPSLEVRLYCAIPKKPSTFELIVQKATELGVTEIVPLVTARCQVQHLGKMNRLHAILKEACEQSERAHIPHLADPMTLKDLLAYPPEGILLAGDPWTFDAPLSELAVSGEINLVIGPEGGLTQEELEAIAHSGGKLFSLGHQVLRMETAAIAALALLLCR